MNDAWLNWARSEELRRLGLALYLHDVEVACLFRREPYLRHRSTAYCSAVSDEAFAACSAKEWLSTCLEHRRIESPVAITLDEWSSTNAASQAHDTVTRSIEISAFTAYAILANIGACLLERRQSRIAAMDSEEFGRSALRSWYAVFTRRIPSESPDSLCLKLLWHHYASFLYADFALLKMALDTRGESADVTSARAWATSSNAPRALFHVCLLHSNALALPLGLSPPIHLPRAIYAAGVIFAAYWRFSPATDQSIRNKLGYQGLVNELAAVILELPEIDTLAREQDERPEQLASWASDVIVRSRSTLPYGCIDLLRKLNRFGVSSIFADMLQTFVRSGLEPS